jgi:hypothetical protein
MLMLTTKQIYVTPATPATMPLQFVKPLSYEFRVAEYVDETGKVDKVKLQVQIWEHDEYGSGTVKHFWSDVPRVKMDRNGSIIP